MKKPTKDEFKITLRKFNCPNCNHELNYFRMPKNLKQALWGGYTCDKCKSELNKHGEIIRNKN